MNVVEYSWLNIVNRQQLMKHVCQKCIIYLQFASQEYWLKYIFGSNFCKNVPHLEELRKDKGIMKIITQIVTSSIIINNNNK